MSTEQRTTLSQTPPADRAQGETPAAGWYPDPQDETGTQLRWWDGDQWTENVGQAEQLRRERDTALLQEELARTESPSTPVASPARRVVLPAGFWVVAIIGLILLLWAAAEVHDQGCYSKTIVQVASGNTSESHCLLLPWNDPVTRQEKQNPYRFSVPLLVEPVGHWV
jgi:hypothetical protein